jgi:hypothetical protein
MIKIGPGQTNCDTENLSNTNSKLFTDCAIASCWEENGICNGNISEKERCYLQELICKVFYVKVSKYIGFTCFKINNLFQYVFNKMDKNLCIKIKKEAFFFTIYFIQKKEDRSSVIQLVQDFFANRMIDVRLEGNFMEMNTEHLKIEMFFNLKVTKSVVSIVPKIGLIWDEGSLIHYFWHLISGEYDIANKIINQQSHKYPALKYLIKVSLMVLKKNPTLIKTYTDLIEYIDKLDDAYSDFDLLGIWVTLEFSKKKIIEKYPKQKKIVNQDIPSLQKKVVVKLKNPGGIFALIDKNITEENVWSIIEVHYGGITHFMKKYFISMNGTLERITSFNYALIIVDNEERLFKSDTLLATMSNEIKFMMKITQSIINEVNKMEENKDYDGVKMIFKQINQFPINNKTINNFNKIMKSVNSVLISFGSDKNNYLMNLFDIMCSIQHKNPEFKINFDGIFTRIGNFLKKKGGDENLIEEDFFYIPYKYFEKDRSNKLLRDILVVIGVYIESSLMSSNIHMIKYFDVLKDEGDLDYNSLVKDFNAKLLSISPTDLFEADKEVYEKYLIELIKSFDYLKKNNVLIKEMYSLVLRLFDSVSMTDEKYQKFSESIKQCVGICLSRKENAKNFFCFFQEKILGEYKNNSKEIVIRSVNILSDILTSENGGYKIPFHSKDFYLVFAQFIKVLYPFAKQEEYCIFVIKQTNVFLKKLQNVESLKENKVFADVFVEDIEEYSKVIKEKGSFKDLREGIELIEEVIKLKIELKVEFKTHLPLFLMGIQLRLVESIIGKYWNEICEGKSGQEYVKEIILLTYKKLENIPIKYRCETPIDSVYKKVSLLYNQKNKSIKKVKN